MKKQFLNVKKHAGRFTKAAVGAVAIAGIVILPMTLAIGQGVASATTGVYATGTFSYCSDVGSQYCMWLPLNATGVLSTTVQPASTVVCDTYTGWYNNGSAWIPGAAGPLFTCNGNPPVAILTEVIAGTPIQVQTPVQDPGFDLSF